MKRIKLPLIALATVVLTMVIVQSCDLGGNLTGSNQTNISHRLGAQSRTVRGPVNIKGNSQSEYLTLKVYKMTEMSKKDLKTVSKARRRLDISLENGPWHIEQTSGAQVNISEKLYKFIKKGFENYNKIVVQDRNRTLDYSVPLLKSNSVEGGGSGGGYQVVGGCYPRALSHISSVNSSFWTIYNYQYGRYGPGPGIPADDLMVEGNYFSSAPLNYYSRYALHLGENLQNTIVVFRTIYGTGHAVNGINVDSTYIIAYDYTISDTIAVPINSVKGVITPDSLGF